MLGYCLTFILMTTQSVSICLLSRRTSYNLARIWRYKNNPFYHQVALHPEKMVLLLLYSWQFQNFLGTKPRLRILLRLTIGVKCRIWLIPLSSRNIRSLFVSSKVFFLTNVLEMFFARSTRPISGSASAS